MTLFTVFLIRNGKINYKILKIENTTKTVQNSKTLFQGIRDQYLLG